MSSRVAGKPYFLYVLWSESRSCFYIGISEAPQIRTAQHNAGGLRAWTQLYRPWKCVLTERYGSYIEARRRELELKSQKGGVGFFHKTGLDPGKFGRRS